MSVTGSWAPDDAVVPTTALVRRFGVGGCDHPDNPAAVVTVAEIESLAPLMRADLDAWTACFEGVPDAELVGFIRFFTLAEMQLPGWRGDAHSPAIAAARELKRRGAWPADLTAWIRAHSDNRFLPYGSLLDRLS